MNMKSRKTTRAFTIMELLVTVAIIALLSGIIMANLSGSRGKARDAQRVSDLGQLQLAMSLYFDRCNSYPSSLATTVNNGCPTGVTLGTFIATIPTPPSGAGQSAYDYATLSSGSVVTNYVLHAVLEQYNAAVAKGLSSMPGGYANGTFTCSTGSTPPIQYCVSNN